jgi:hypothetical protein
MGNPEEISFEHRADEARNEFVVTVTGRSRMPWYEAPGSRATQYQFSDYVISWDADLDREAGQGKDAPFALPFPVHVTSRETVILPNGGTGFRMVGKPLQAEVAGTQIRRDLALSGGRAVATSSFKRLRNEVSATEANAAKAQIELVQADSSIRAHPGRLRAEPG